MGTDLQERSIDKIARLSGEPRDLVGYWRECTGVIASVIPHYWTPCWYTLDPASLLATSHFHEGMPEFPPEWLAHEYYDDDVNQMVDVAGSETGISTLHEATDGDPSRSRRYTFNRSLGSDQEMVARLRAPSGEVWGMLGLYRELGQPMFDERDKQFLRAVSGHLAEGARRALLVGEALSPDVTLPDAPGLLIVSETWELQSATPGIDRWLAELPGGDPDRGDLPPSVVAVAARTRRTAENPHRPSGTTVARVMARNGTWVVLHGAYLEDAGSHRIAVIVEPAHPARIHPLLEAAYQLTARERDVTRLVLQGASTSQIAEQLFVSPHTVQQHLKSVFAKTGVRSRRDLVGKIFFTHYEPGFRDNERRVAGGVPMLGGPRT
ncbi:LuxR C-terminal-related transcriptional regulator [Nocardioides cynanchi]|uniref:LuxR C-terminal-related transcriptional regulator n=1 Tax=Nocardioides cynanchi TaxID=2558918 RepID=UPI001243FFCC|nr:LuxR C-terminal-related transcriptional regulator [Nocardioides cynanchi]